MQKGLLRLDSPAAALKGGFSGPALILGDPDKSLMLVRAMHNDPMREVPPKDPPTEADLAALRRWIAAGAPWPEPKEKPAKQIAVQEKVGDAWSDPRTPCVKAFNGKRLDLWSLKPISQPALPAVKDKAWPRNEVDAFILAKIEAAGLKPAPEADKRMLARRLYFDLTGLPPTPEELAAYLADTSPDAYHHLVTRLLDSHSYGEHWGRMWLDVVRYSDSNGFDDDEFRPTAWRFRDYVIRSLNADKPYDRFVKEQLAGDERLPVHRAILRSRTASLPPASSVSGRMTTVPPSLARRSAAAHRSCLIWSRPREPLSWGSLSTAAAAMITRSIPSPTPITIG